jgi:uncharacterized membrane protein
MNVINQEDQQPVRNSSSRIAVFLAAIILIFLGLSLPLHYVPSRGMVFPKDTWTFSYTIITQSDIDNIVSRYNSASFFEKMALNQEPIVRKLKEKGLIYDKKNEN